jgi:hypothetical protein
MAPESVVQVTYRLGAFNLAVFMSEAGGWLAAGVERVLEDPGWERLIYVESPFARTIETLYQQ